jgi:hypothetical protein
MHNMMMGPLWGIIAIATFTGAITLGCFVAMFKFLIRPGEKDPHHPKYDILRPDR